MRTVLVGFLSALALTCGLLAIPQETPTAMRHSCGYHCTLDGSAATPVVRAEVQLAGRTNIHSGGRLHGSANKRVGCGGCKGHPASASIGNSVWLLD